MGGARPPRPAGRASRAQTPAPESTFEASPTPHDKMATWTAGEPGRRGWGKRGEGSSSRNKKAAPPNPINAEAGPGAQGGQAGGVAGAEGGGPREWAYFFLSFAPPAPSMVNRSPRCLHGGRPPGSLRPKRWLPPHAEREGKASPEVGVRGGKPLVRLERSGRQSPGSGPGSEPLLRWLVRAQPDALAEATTRVILLSPQTRQHCALRS